MKTRLALVACKDSTVGPWIRSRGNETGVRVMHLGKFEHVNMEVEIAGSQETIILAGIGVFELPEKWDRVRFHKLCEGEGECHTQVDLLVA